MKELEDYLKLWQLTKPELLATTHSSHVYKVICNKDFAVLKILNAKGAIHESDGAVALQCFNGHSAARLIDSSDFAHLIEYVDGPNLKTLVQEGKDEQATEIISEVINNLHRANGEPYLKRLSTLKDRFSSLFEKAEQDKQAGKKSLYMQAADVANNLLSKPQLECVLHGDIHHENILLSSKRGWLAIDPKGIYGEATYDAANTLCNPGGMEEFVVNEHRLLKNAKILADKCNFNINRLLGFAFTHTCLSAAWSEEDNEDNSESLKIAKIIEPHLIV